MKNASTNAQLAQFVAKFDPPIGQLIRSSHKAMRKRLPGAYELVYDNYNFFVIGFGPSERPSESLFSIAAHARGANLCFLTGAKLKDPHKLLRGSGKIVRNVVLKSAADITTAPIENFIAQALSLAKWKISPGGKNKLVIKSVSAKQRPRKRPAKSR
jgi:hypothetical protein